MVIEFFFLFCLNSSMYFLGLTKKCFKILVRGLETLEQRCAWQLSDSFHLANGKGKFTPEFRKYVAHGSIRFCCYKDKTTSVPLQHIKE